jgi:hypothetical protein
LIDVDTSFTPEENAHSPSCPNGLIVIIIIIIILYELEESGATKGADMCGGKYGKPE